MSKIELFGTPSCQFTNDLRDDLEWDGRPFVEYDVEKNEHAFQRMIKLTNGNRTVPVLVENDVVVQIGLNGRGCVVGPPSHADEE